MSRTSRLRKNEQNGQRLLELCSLRNLCITYTFFEGKPQHYVSWKPPRYHRWHHLDLLITRPRSLLNVLSTRSYHSADCNTDHVLVCNSTAQRNQAIPAKNTASTSDSASAQIPQQGTGSPRGPPGSGCHLQVGPLEGGHPLFGHVGSQRNGQA